MHSRFVSVRCAAMNYKSDIIYHVIQSTSFIVFLICVIVKQILSMVIWEKCIATLMAENGLVHFVCY